MIKKIGDIETKVIQKLSERCRVSQTNAINYGQSDLRAFNFYIVNYFTYKTIRFRKQCLHKDLVFINWQLMSAWKYLVRRTLFLKTEDRADTALFTKRMAFSICQLFNWNIFYNPMTFQPYRLLSVALQFCCCHYLGIPPLSGSTPDKNCPAIKLYIMWSVIVA